jgi:hypothetical protein
VDLPDANGRYADVSTDLEPDRRFRPLDAVGRLSLDPIGLDVGIGIGFSTAPAAWT